MKKIRKHNPKTLPTIGWREWVGIPELKIKKIKVKVDTGARTSALHASNIQEFRKAGEQWVRFKIHPIQRNSKKTVESEAKVLEYRAVRSSNGKTENRPVIVTEVVLLGTSWPVELTLTGRDAMGFRMLLGREAMRHKFLVDPGKSYYGGRPKRKKKKPKPIR